VTEVRFYTDEHIARAVVSALRQRGVDVRTTLEAGLLGAADEAHLAFALVEGRVLLTQDADFLALAASGMPHSGIAYAPQITTVGAIVRGAMLIHQLATAEEMAGRVEFV
jgi:predicted nuclease of predicted toxin-antitoxin system